MPYRRILESLLARVAGARTALLLTLGQAYFKAGRFGEARERLEEAMRKDPAGPAGRAAAEQLKALPK